MTDDRARFVPLPGARFGEQPFDMLDKHWRHTFKIHARSAVVDGRPMIVLEIMRDGKRYIFPLEPDAAEKVRESLVREIDNVGLARMAKGRG